ncbi:MAG TPA: SLBB domain-containing protein [Silvibacterium sp.]|nr:SLBB domain-containing protein [Silvibacterium sp.]
MRKHLIFGLSVLFAVFSPLATAQNTPTGDEYPSGALNGQSVDCSDPLMASSPACQSGGHGVNDGNSSQAGGQIPGLPPAQAPQPLPQPGMTRPQTYIDNGDNQNYLLDSYYRLLNQKPLPPQPLTEFQKFVAGTTGEVLPVFGSDLFQNAPSTFSPVDDAPIPPDYIIGPGDELRIRIWGQVNFNANVRVDRAGEIYLPQVGEVHVAGLPYQALSQHLHDAISRVFRNFDLTADIGQIRAVQVYVVGQAHRPGTYTVSSLSTLFDVLFVSGGPSIDGSMRHIYLKRGGNVVVDFDLYDLLVNGDKSKDAKLQSGDVIFIPPVGPEVALAGSVRRPAIYELRGDTTIGQVISYAGGESSTASKARISVERIQDRQGRVAMEVASDQQGLATLVQEGDILRVLSAVPMYKMTVTLRGNTANPGRFAWHAGMRLSDLIPDRESLLTRDYWWNRVELGLPAPQFEPMPISATQSQPSQPVDLRNRARYFPLTPAECRAYSQTYGANWYRCEQSGSASAKNPSQTNGQMAPGENGPKESDDGQSIEQQHAAANRQAGSGTLAARQNEVVTENIEGATQHTRVNLPAPEIDWDYAVIERLDPNTLKTSLIPFDLGKLVMEHDPSQDLALQPGDIVSVFSQADIHVPIAQQTKFVRLEGEFVHAGTYSVKPGETLPELIARAGGLTSNAYLYGSQFTRESTRVMQQQRIDEYVQSLQLEINRGMLAQSASAVATPQDIASATAAAAPEHELIARLQQIRATGRIVLEEKPDSSGVANLAPIQLQDGDSFIVPSKPASVNVVGAVYDENSFLYVRHREVGDYLHLAGGPNRDADRKHAFIIRADGSVISRAAASGVWGNTFDSLRMNPGDTIVVPERTFRPTLLRGFLDWSQVVSQLGLGAAAINVLR